ncbi:MAG: AtpZ/AtpI family protein [Gammaproteobacteria bacterium]|nr:AtpZ/AtpI family protein [Gammaproteobacteria bacterium]
MWLLKSADSGQLKIAGRVGAIGIELGLGLCLGYFGGRWLDGQLGTAPWLTWVGVALGLAAGAKSLYQLTRKTQADLNAGEEEERARYFNSERPPAD